MSLRIRTNAAALQTHANLTSTSKAMGKSLEKLSSGFRINRAADDAAGLAIANKFRADIRSSRVAQRNTAEATSMIQIAEGATSSIEDILVRMKELATQAASSNSSTQTSVLNEEFGFLKSEIDRIVSATNYQGTALIDGSFSGTFQIGTTNNSYDQLALTLSDLDTTALAVNDDSVASLASAQASLTAIDTALGTVRSALGKIGAYQNRLEFASQNLSTSIQNYSASESVIRDADMAFEMVEFTKNQILQRAGTSMLAQANQAPQGVLQLLG